MKKTIDKKQSKHTLAAPSPVSKEFTYLIGGKKYVQRPLVLGQMQQLMALLRGVVIPDNIPGIIEAVGFKLPEAMAIVLIPEGSSTLEKNVDEMAAELAATADLDTSVRVIEDFFAVTPAASLSARLAGVIGKMAGMTSQQTAESAS